MHVELRRLLTSRAIAFALSVVLSGGIGVAIGRTQAAEDEGRRLVLPAGRLVIGNHPSITLPESLTENQLRLPEYSLRVHTDGCGVIRSEAPGRPPHGLGWSVKDADGFEVLQRNARGETRYRYYRPGVYTVVLVAWGGGSYVPVSNSVTIRC